MRNNYILLILLFFIPSLQISLYGFNIVRDSVKVNNKSIVVEDVEFCTPEIILETTETHNDYLYHASEKIVIKNDYNIQLPANEKIVMKAGYQIEIKPGVKIKEGVKYLARIEQCSESTCVDYEIPKGISPNGDNKNDYFDLSNFCPVKRIQIFNRYGLKVYEKYDYLSEWDGKDSKSNILPTGVYYYVINFENENIKTGWVYINR